MHRRCPTPVPGPRTTRRRESVAVVTPGHNASAPGASRQLPLALRYPPDQRLDTFVAAPAGAVQLLRALAHASRQAGDGDWVYLRGVSGTGKTHLALGVCAAAEEAGRRVAYVPVGTVAGHVDAALEALDQCDVVALDGIEAVAGRRDGEVALFEFHNRARSTGTALLYTARASPDALPIGLPDLRSRLSQCTHVVLSPLDEPGRREVLRQRARRRGLGMDDAAIDWLLRRTDRDLSSLTVLLDRLDRESLAAKRRITVPFLRDVLRDVLGGSAGAAVSS